MHFSPPPPPRSIELQIGLRGKGTQSFLHSLQTKVGRILRISNLRTGTPQQLVNLRLRNKPRNLRICGLTKKIFAFPPLITIQNHLN
jgi:hypothetical protein